MSSSIQHKGESISIVIPTYNSGSYILKTLKKIGNWIASQERDIQLLVVNDGSNDNTIDQCKEAKEHVKFTLIQLEKNYGQRVATCIGYQYAKTRYVITFDDDLQYSLNEINDLIAKIKSDNALVVSGFASSPEETQEYKISKQFVLLLFNYLFFPKYKEKKYFTSLKIYDKLQLDKRGFVNIYFFWELPIKRLSSIRIKKSHRIEGKSQYDLGQFFRLLFPLVLKVFSKTLILSIIVSSAFFFYVGKINYAIIISLCSALVLTSLGLGKLKHAFTKIHFSEM
jgi:glycosyltransferase involved in cell wall biosynthesis